MKIQAPGRICLFGEHQDYLGYPVVASAINRYIWVEGTPLKNDKSTQTQVIMSTPDIKNSKTVSYILDGSKLQYNNKRDYLPSCINVAFDNGCKWKDETWEVSITGNIPINAGASSSSALVIGFINFLFQISNNLDSNPFSKNLLGKLGYNAEVAEFGESGGMMDHFASAHGNVIMVESQPEFQATTLRKNLEGFVLANSKVKKSTVDDLRNVKTRAINSFNKIKEFLPEFDRFSTPIEDVQEIADSLPEDIKSIGLGNLENRDITKKGVELLRKTSLTLEDKRKLGLLISRHHTILSENIEISIPKIDKMVKIALEAGAFGAKINGSGFGGTMFAYAPTKQNEVYEALKREGYNCWKVKVSDGSKIIF